MSQNIILVLAFPPQPLKNIKITFSWQTIQKQAMGWAWASGPSGKRRDRSVSPHSYKKPKPENSTNLYIINAWTQNIKL